MILPSIINIAQICAHHQVKHIILSPGSRCAPLTLAFVRHPEIITRTVSDERSAAFIALGIARQLHEPVGLVCTSGSAAYNYAPAIAEAYFQQIPLIVFTADRPPEWIDQLDGQTIWQRNIYGQHVKKSYELPVDNSQPDATWFAARTVSEAINLSKAYPSGPVHINVPVREPFYPEKDEKIVFDPTIKVIRQTEIKYSLSDEMIDQLRQAWSQSDRKLIVCGQSVQGTTLSFSLEKLSKTQGIPVIADIISNHHSVHAVIKNADTLLARKDESFLQSLQPDLLITFGLSVISKNLKLFLRQYRPKAHWHIQPAGEVADTFQALTQIIRTEPATFFEVVANFLANNDQQKEYFQFWQAAGKNTEQFINTLFEPDSNNELSTKQGEFLAIQLVLNQLPDRVNLHLANSMSVRYANIIGLNDSQKNIEVFANRGTSGIDGSNSTAVGSALASEKLTVLITGDMAFFYDRNAFWHNYPLANLRIVVLNNHAGGIFRIIDGPNRQPELVEYFETQQFLNAENTARDFQMKYYHCNLTQSDGLSELKSILKVFFEKSEKAKLLEITSDSKTNQQIFNQYKNLINQGYGS